jgi:hypothetical protein
MKTVAIINNKGHAEDRQSPEELARKDLPVLPHLARGRTGKMN